jgi:hypothetical protein
MSSTQNEPGSQFFSFVSEDFRENDPVRVACSNIAKYIFSSSKDQLQHLTFGMLRKAAGLDDTENSILHRAISYLTGERANLLIVGYEFIDDDLEHEMQPDEVDHFLREGKFVHPITGELVENCAEHIYIFFRPNYAVFH